MALQLQNSELNWGIYSLNCCIDFSSTKRIVVMFTRFTLLCFYIIVIFAITNAQTMPGGSNLLTNDLMHKKKKDKVRVIFNNCLFVCYIILSKHLRLLHWEITQEKLIEKKRGVRKIFQPINWNSNKKKAFLGNL